MTPKVIRRIVRQSSSCVMFKHEDWPGLEKITAMRGFEADGIHAPHLHPLRKRRSLPRL